MLISKMYEPSESVLVLKEKTFKFDNKGEKIKK
jgi:hypothetical protein